MCQKANFAEASFFAKLCVQSENWFRLLPQWTRERECVHFYSLPIHIFSPLSLTGIVNESRTNNPDDAESG